MNITTFQEVFDSFLSKINTYEFLKLSEQELNIDLGQNLRSALAKCIGFKDIIADYVLEEFNRVLTDLEIDIISNWMVFNWITPKINNIESIKQAISSKDYQIYSQANHLKELLDLKNDAKTEAHYWMNRYGYLKKLEKPIVVPIRGQ